MDSLFNNAIQSIQAGVEDFEYGTPPRLGSAVRNFYAGVLLLAKEALVRAVPNADPQDIIGTNHKPIPDEKGGVIFKASKQTIDFNLIAERFKQFGVNVNTKRLADLQDVRNDIEHRFTDQSEASVREVIARAFPVVVELLEVLKEPPTILGDAWDTMLEVRGVYDLELEKCIKSFQKLDWKSKTLRKAKRTCYVCDSELVIQKDTNNTDFQSMRVVCRSCNEDFDAEFFVAHILQKHFEVDDYIAAKEGSDPVVDMCPECGLETYITSNTEVGCCWCETVLGFCGVCGTDLNPNVVSAENSSLCGYCADKGKRDD